MKKLTALLLAALMVFALAACGSNNAEPESNDAADKIVVGVCQLVQHEALDAATQGFVDTLKAEFGEDAIEILVENASGDAQNCTTICNGFVSKGVDLIMANATPALQAAVAATGDIPVLGTSVTEYGTALGIDDFSGVVGGNISGTSDLASLAEQAKMITDWVPDAKTVGILFCSAEANSAYQVKVVKEELEKAGIEVEEFAFTDSNDVASVTQKAVDSCDALFIPTDNTAASNIEAIGNIVLEAKIPVITGEKGTAAVCGVATLSIDYYNLGVTTANMAIKILKGEADIATMAIENDPNPVKMFNAEVCELLGLTPLEGFEAIA